MEQPLNIKELFNRYLNDQCSPEELQLLMEYFHSGQNENLLKSLIKAELEGSPDMPPDTAPEVKLKLDELFQNIKKRINKKE